MPKFNTGGASKKGGAVKSTYTIGAPSVGKNSSKGSSKGGSTSGRDGANITFNRKS